MSIGSCRNSLSMKPKIRSKSAGQRTSELSWFWVLCLCGFIFSADGATQTNKAKDEVWWSLKPVVRPAVPKGSESNPIDRFLNAEFKSRGIKAVGITDKSTLLRRVYLDLIGIPPTPEEQEAFLSDSSTNAYEKVVDELL